jgi:hypothetical protein
MIAVVDGIPKRVSIKYTSERGDTKSKVTWAVSLRQVSRRANNTVSVTKFNPNDWDIVAVYIGPEDRVVLKAIDSNFTNTTGIYVE